MTIWNALSAGGALWFAGLYVGNLRNTYSSLAEAAFGHALSATCCLAFGLCLWGAIP